METNLIANCRTFILSNFLANIDHCGLVFNLLLNSLPHGNTPGDKILKARFLISFLWFNLLSKFWKKSLKLCQDILFLLTFFECNVFLDFLQIEVFNSFVENLSHESLRITLFAFLKLLLQAILGLIGHYDTSSILKESCQRIFSKLVLNTPRHNILHFILQIWQVAFICQLVHLEERLSSIEHIQMFESCREVVSQSWPQKAARFWLDLRWGSLYVCQWYP